MSSSTGIFAIILSAVLTNNFIFSQFLGCCPFLGCSSKIDTAAGMGLAVTFVMVMTVPLNYLLYEYVLKANALVEGVDLNFLSFIVFIATIAAFVQLVEMIVEKFSPTLYSQLGIFLPLITTNCAVLGVAILMIQKEFNLLQSIVYSVATAIGFALALVLFAGIRERLELEDVPKAVQGVPVALITAGILAMAFMGFSGLV